MEIIGEGWVKPFLLYFYRKSNIRIIKPLLGEYECTPLR